MSLIGSIMINKSINSFFSKIFESIFFSFLKFVDFIHATIRFLRAVYAYIGSGPIKMYIILLIATSLFVVYKSWNYYNPSFYENILVEAHGMLFDIFVLGVIVSILNLRIERNYAVERLENEIEDFLEWEETEAYYRIRGCIYRLNKLGVSDIKLRGANLSNLNLRMVDLHNADLRDVNFSNSFLGVANFQRACLIGSNFSGANLQGAKFDKADLKNTNFNGVLNLEAHMLHNAYCLHGSTNIDPVIKAELMEKKPELFEYIHGIKGT